MFVVSPLLISRGYVGVIYSFVGLKYFIIKESGSVGSVGPAFLRGSSWRELSHCCLLQMPRKLSGLSQSSATCCLLLSPWLSLSHPFSVAFDLWPWGIRRVNLLEIVMVFSASM